MKLINKFRSKFKSKFKFEKLIFPVFLAAILLHILFKLIIPFLRFNNLYAWDTAGHYFSAWYVKEFLFPRLIGWNPFFFLGFPQGQFYPPLYSWLSAAFGQIFGLELGFKLVLIAAIVLTPLAFYYFARKFGFSQLKASITMLAMYTILFLIPAEHLGGNMHATFNVGLVTNALALPLFFFYLGKLKSAFERKLNVDCIIVSVLFALIILSHVFTAIAAAVAFIAFALAKARTKPDFLFAGKHILLTVLLSAFWTLPFVFKLDYARSIKIGYGLVPYMPLFLALSAAYFLFTTYKRKNLLSLSLFILFLLAFVFFVDKYQLLPLHFYRFQLFLYLFVPVVVLDLIRENEKLELFFLFVIVGACVYFVLSASQLYTTGVIDIPKYNNINVVDGRILVLASPNTQASPHFLQHFVPKMSGNYAVRGLFIESAPNAKYIFGIERSFLQDSFIWATLELPRTDVNYSIIQKQLALFNINYALSFYQADSSWDKIQRTTFFNMYNQEKGVIERYFYDFYKVGNSSLIEVLDYTPSVIKNKAIWENAVMDWFSTEDVSHVFVNDDVPQYKGNGKEEIEIIETAPTQEYIKFKVNSAETVPILIKISAFPNWKAYIEGKETKIYRASPYLMLIYGKGLIELRYKSLFIDELGLLLSLSGIGLIFLIFIKNGKKKLKKERGK